MGDYGGQWERTAILWEIRAVYGVRRPFALGGQEKPMGEKAKPRGPSKGRSANIVHEMFFFGRQADGLNEAAG
jgi:hypothetical protein